MNSTTSAHDGFVRSILSNKNVAVNYFKNYLPTSINKQLDFSTLTQLPDTYLSGDLQKTMSDIVYSCQRKRTKKIIKVSLLVEHKSHPDKYTPVQIGGYIFSALQKQVANKEPLSIVIPVLLYHGKEKWLYRTVADLFDKTDAEWKQYIPSFEYIYNNLGELSDAEVEKLNNKFLAAAFLALKHSAEKKWLSQNAVKLLLLTANESKILQKGFVIYLSSRVKLEEKNLNLLPAPLKKRVMNTLDIYIKKGRKEGLAEGRREGMEKGIEKGIEKGKEQVVKNLLLNTEFTMAKIAALANVTEAFVKRVKAGIK